MDMRDYCNDTLCVKAQGLQGKQKGLSNAIYNSRN